MEQNIVEVINSLSESEQLFQIGEVDISDIEEAQKTLGLEFSKDFIEYTQTFGSISIGSIELFGVIEEDPDLSTVDRTIELRDEYSDFPKDCYAIEDVGMEGTINVQKSDGKIYQFMHNQELLLLANSLSDYLQENI